MLLKLCVTCWFIFLYLFNNTRTTSKMIYLNNVILFLLLIFGYLKEITFCTPALVMIVLPLKVHGQCRWSVVQQALVAYVFCQFSSVVRCWGYPADLNKGRCRNKLLRVWHVGAPCIPYRTLPRPVIVEEKFLRCTYWRGWHVSSRLFWKWNKFILIGHNQI